MNCSNCGKNVDDDLSYCPYCGELLRPESKVEVDYVYDETDIRNSGTIKGSRIVLIVIAALIVCIGAFAFWMMTRQNANPAAGATPSELSGGNEQVKARSPEMPSLAPPNTVAPTTVPATTQAPQTTAPSAEERMEEYARSSGMMDMLRQAADEHTTYTVRGEENALRVRYRVDLDSTAGENAQYFEALPNTYDDLCSGLDRLVYEMNQQSDINNAVLEVFVFDSNGTQVYANTVD